MFPLVDLPAARMAILPSAIVASAVAPVQTLEAYIASAVPSAPVRLWIHLQDTPSIAPYLGCEVARPTPSAAGGQMVAD